jgi:hypothetical protein
MVWLFENYLKVTSSVFFYFFLKLEYNIRPIKKYKCPAGVDIGIISNTAVK